MVRKPERNFVRERSNLRLNLGDQGKHPNLMRRSTGGIEKDTFSFFFTNFLEDFLFQELWKAFMKWGKVVDVYVPLKRDEFWKKFGFVRILEVNNIRALEEQFSSIWFGSYRLKKIYQNTIVTKCQGSHRSINLSQRQLLIL